jgi:hypothetical protein
MAGSQGGYGGLLDSLMYQSPLNKPEEVQQPQYDPMGNFTGVTPQTAQDPFGPPPQLAQWAQQFAPKSPFSGMTPVAPVQQFAGVPIQPQAAPAPQEAPTAPIDGPDRTINIGGYQMPQFGSAPQMAGGPQSPTDVSAASRQPGQAAPQNLPPAFGSEGDGNFAAGLRNFGSPGGLINKVADAVEGFTTGRRTDPTSVKQQNLKAQYESLVPMLGPQKAMLAVMNPEAGKILLAQALDKKQYGFQKMDNDTVLRTDPLTGKVDLAYGGGDTNKEGVAGPDGKMIPYPAGLDAAGRKTFANEIAKINADAATGKKTEVQANAEQFGNRMESAEQNFSKVSTEGVGLKGAAQGAVGALPLGGFAQSSNYQKMEQAKRQWVTALLRKESGAAIGKQEYSDYDRQFFPQPGDSAEVVAQKAHERVVAVDAMKRGAGPGYKSPAAEQPKIRKYNPTTGTIE